MIQRLVLIALSVVLMLTVLAAGGIYWFLSRDGIRLALEQQASTWLEQPVHIKAVSARFFPRLAIRLDTVQVGMPSRLTLANIEISTAAAALLQRRVVDAELRISNSRIDLPLPFIVPASGDAETQPSSRATQAVRIESVRSIVLDDVTVRSRGREITVSADSALIGTQLRLRELTARSGRTSIRAEGIFELEPRLDGKLRVNANRLDLDELLALADAFAGTPQRRSTNREKKTAIAKALPPRIAARVSAETATAGGVNISQFATDLEVEGDHVSLSPLNFQLFGGKYQGSLSVTLGDSLAVKLQSRIISLDVAQLATFGNAADSISGRLSGAGTFSGSGSDFAEVLRTARGDGSAEIVDGAIRRLNLVRTVVLFFGRPAADAPPSTDRFDRIDLRFALAQQMFRAEALSLHSPDADLVGSGTLNVPKKALEGTLDLSLSEALSAQAGTDLYRYTRDGNRIVLPASISGTVTSPRLTIDAASALKRGLRNEVGRRLGGLLERLRRQE